MRILYIIYCLIVSATITSYNYAELNDSYRGWSNGSGYHGTGGGGGFHK